MRRRFRPCTLCLLLMPALFTARAQDPNAIIEANQGPTERHRLKLFAGASQIFDAHVDPVVGFELQPGWRWHGIGLWASLCGGKRTGSYAASGISYSIPLSESWKLTPSFGLGYFKEGKFELGNELEFRSAIELTRKLQRGFNLGVSLAHISNASLSNINPGTEAVCVSLSFPIF